MAQATAVREDARTDPPRGAGRTFNPTAGLAEVSSEIERLDLADEIRHLDTFGYVIVSPEKMGPPGFEQHLLGAACRIAEAESGIKPDLETGSTHSNVGKGRQKLFPFQEEFSNPIFKDRAFEELLMNPVVLALATYLLGEHMQLSTNGVWFRGPTETPPEKGFVPKSLHSDNYGVPSPFPVWAQICNATMPLTDYSFEGGCLGFVPGSHALMRHPLHTGELLDTWVPAECPAGSLIFWHGNTWHTIGNPRVIPGIRVSMSMVFTRPHMLPINIYRGRVPQEMLDRNDDRFRMLMGYNQRFGNDPVEQGQEFFNATADGIPGTPSVWQ